jgi:hypothetical protein
MKQKINDIQESNFKYYWSLRNNNIDMDLYKKIQLYGTKKTPIQNRRGIKSI